MKANQEGRLEVAPTRSAGRHERVSFLGVPVDSLTLAEAVSVVDAFVREGGTHVVTAINANKLWLVARDAKLRAAILKSDLNIPEWAVVWGAAKLGTPLRGQVAGITLLQELLDVARGRGWSVFFLGARPETVRAMVDRVKARLPSVRVSGWRDGFFAPEEIPGICARIRKADPDLLFVALGTPKQEHWILDHARSTGARVALGVGGSFDVLAGEKPDTPPWARGRGLEWLYRLWLDPGHLWKRYLVTNSWFVARVVGARLRLAWGSARRRRAAP